MTNYGKRTSLRVPLVDLATTSRLSISPVVPLDSNFYMLAFIALFYAGFAYFCFFRLERFRELVIAVILLQIFGTIGYLVMPALGPFVYEAGIEPRASGAQASMHAVWQQNSLHGARWLAAEGGRHFTAGLAAVPSLHTGGAFLFVLFAHRYAQRLNVLFLPIFLFIAIDAVANRWHYLIDLPAGMALAAVAMVLARALADRSVRDGNQISPKATGRPFDQPVLR